MRKDSTEATQDIGPETMEQQLNDLRLEIRNLHDCLDGMRDEQQDLNTNITTLGHRMSNYFLGIQPEIHIRHHNGITDMSDDSKEKKRIGRETLGMIIGTIVATAVINLAGMYFITTSISKTLQETQHIEQVKK